MYKSPRIVAWVLAMALFALSIPLFSFVTPTASAASIYTGRVVRSDVNCGLTQIYGTLLDSAGSPRSGVKLQIWWADGSTTTTSGSYIRNETDASGWDFTLNTRPVANTWQVAVVDGSGNLLSDKLPVTTTNECTGNGAANVVKVEFKEGGAPAPAPTPSGGTGGTTPPPASDNTSPAPAITAGATCEFYTQTNGGAGGGYSVCNDGNANFLTTFRRYGLQNVGYPVSQRYKRDGFITQAFQKAIFQWRPDGSYVAFVNVFDELNSRGLDQRLLASRQTPFQLPAGWEGVNVPFEQAVTLRQALLNERPALRRTYFSVADPLLFFGLPTSEVEDMGNHYAIRLQRAVLQEWKETVPWASAGQVTVANGADIAKELGHLPTFSLATEASPPNGTGGAASAPPPPANVSGFRYGMQAHMIYNDRAQIFNSTRGLGFSWLKQQIEWKVFEQSQGQISWGEMDAIANEAKANGMTMLFSAVGAPGWAREAGYDAGVAGPPANPATFASFLGQVASRYCNNGVGAIEVWNEQNLHYEWGNKPISPADYMALLKPSYTAIKAACPSMIVVSGALTPTGAPAPLAMDDFTYLTGMYANGLKNYADAIGMHPSGFNVPPTLTHSQACSYLQGKNASFMGPCNSVHHSWSFKSTVDGYRNIMVQNGDTAKSLWATEFGWAAGGAFHPSYGYANDNSYQDQADWTVQAYQYMKNSGFVGGAFLWNLNFRVIADGTEKAQWGIVDNRWQPLPVYSALAAMVK